MGPTLLSVDGLAHDRFGATSIRARVARISHVGLQGGDYRGGVPAWPQPPLPAQWTGTANLPPFVGRRRELEALEGMWTAVERGARQVVFLGGEPGAGKSRLTAAVALALQRGGVSVLVGSCVPELSLPFDPFVQPVRTLLPAVDAGQLQLEGEGVSNPDEARDLLRLLTEGTTHGSRPIAGARAPVVFEAVVALLRTASAARPLLLVLEDLHWAGESALRFLTFVVERTAELPILVIATYRSTRPDRSDALSTAMANLMRATGVHRIDLQGLDTEEVADYLTASHAGSPAEVRQGAALLRDSTGGNPFVLREVWRDLDRSGGLVSLAAGEIVVPESLRTVIATRLAQLPALHQQLVLLGAVIGEDFAVELVRAAAADDAVTSSDVFAAMRAATAVGVLEPAPRGVGTMRFPHALARQAVLDSVDPFELAASHAQVAFALEEGFVAEPHRVQRLAHHFASASGLGLDDRAVQYLEQAAGAAAERLAYSDAAALYERASAYAAQPDERDRLRLAAARSHLLAGRMSRAREIDEQVVIGGHPGYRLEAAIGFEAASWRSGEPGDRAITLLRSALATADVAEEHPAFIRALAALGRATALTGQIDVALEHTRRSLTLARATGDSGLLAAVLQATMHAWGVAGLRGRVPQAEELTVLAYERGELRRLAAPASIRAFAAYTMGDVEALEQASTDLARAVRATQQPYWRWVLYLMETTRRICRCDFIGANETIRSARLVEGALESGHGGSEGPLSLQSFMVRRETGGLEFARATLGQLDSLDNPWRPAVVALCMELGLREAAIPALTAAVSQDFPRLRASATWPISLSFLGEGAAWLRDRTACELLLPQAEEFAGLNLLGAEFLAVAGSGDRLIAVLKAAMGMPGVEGHFATALAMDQRMGSPLHVATTEAEWAAYLRRMRAPTKQVEEHAAVARELADRHGLARVRRILGPDAEAGPAALPDGLTARELDVLRLIGHGRSNRDIALELVISEYTAANHVRSILMKTQCANRTAAAHYAMEHGLLADASHDRRE
jgi:DNA-binding CsgD family transcriptional regulator